MILHVRAECVSTIITNTSLLLFLLMHTECIQTESKNTKYTQFSRYQVIDKEEITFEHHGDNSNNILINTW